MCEFKIRPYTKSQLAMMYFPEPTEASACRRLMRWIRKCKALSTELEKTNYDRTSRWFTPRQVALIAEYLGEP